MTLLHEMPKAGSDRRTRPPRSTSGRFGRSVRRTFLRTLLYCSLIGVAVATLFPVAWMLYSSLKPTTAIFTNVFSIPTKPFFGNYTEVLADTHMLTWIRNSLVVTCASVTVLVVVCCCAAYAFSVCAFRGKEIVFVGLLVGLMVPPQALVVAGFKWINILGLMDTLTALVLTYGGWSPFGILVVRAFFDTVPREIIDAARVDGAGHWRVFTRIMLPLAKPAIVTITIFYFIWIWNDFVYPLVYLQQQDLLTVPVGVLEFKSRLGVQWGPLTAALSMATVVPLLVYIAARRQFVRGLLHGALKG